MYIPYDALYYQAMGLQNWFHSKWLIKTPAITQHSCALDFQFCCRSWFSFAYVFAGKTNYQMAHGYFYILYGGLPADNYDITGRLLCFALRNFGRGHHHKLFHLTLHCLTDIYKLFVDKSLKISGKNFLSYKWGSTNIMFTKQWTVFSIPLYCQKTHIYLKFSSSR